MQPQHQSKYVDGHQKALQQLSSSQQQSATAWPASQPWQCMLFNCVTDPATLFARHLFTKEEFTLSWLLHSAYDSIFQSKYVAWHVNDENLADY